MAFWDPGGGGGGGGEQYPTAQNVISVLEPKYLKLFLT